MDLDQRPDSSGGGTGGLRALLAYFAVLAISCSAFTWAALALGKTANLVAAAYMLIPALAASIARAGFHGPRFTDAALRPGKLRRYAWIWLAGVGLVVLQFAAFLASGAVTIDLTGQGFLDQIERVMPGGSAAMLEQLPRGMSLTGMLALYTLGGITVFNIPGIVLGFGEEFGWRGLMFPLLYRIRPWLAFVAGGLVWYLWHLPLALLGPRPAESPAAMALHVAVLAAGAVATFTVFAWIFVRAGSIWGPALFHAVINNGSRALSYWVRIENQWVADAVLAAIMAAVVATLWRTGQLRGELLRRFPPLGGAGGDPRQRRGLTQ